MYLALNLLAEFIIPIPVHALTGGPSQPEVESFEPVSTTEMVNLFTGDFNYNIPLLTVPGPNGGYPINLAYHAGIGMEQEASWTGLGWNINPGVINRNMRGVPDDFDGDEVVKTMYYKPQQTWAMDYASFEIGASSITPVTYYPPLNKEVEIIGGFSSRKATISTAFSYQVHYNNYKGVGAGIHMSLSNIAAKHLGPQHSLTLDISYDTDGGLGLSPSYSYDHKKSSVTHAYKIGMSYNSRQGTFSLKASVNKIKEIAKNCDRKHFYWGKSADYNSKSTTVDRLKMTFTTPGPGSGIAFSTASSIPGNVGPIKGTYLRLGVTIGDPDAVGYDFKKYDVKKFTMSFTGTSSTEDNSVYNAFGFQYLQDAQITTGENYILDFNVEGDGRSTKNQSSISQSYGTNDILFASGQGISGAFKLFRADNGVYHDGAVTNQIPGAAIQVEFGHEITSGHLRIGGDYGANYSQSYSGDWKSGTSNLSNLVFADPSEGLFEPAYYKSTGEMTASPTDEMYHIGGDDATRFNLRSVVEGDFGIVTKVENELISDQNDLYPNDVNTHNARTTRQRRAQLLSYRTSGQVDHTIGYGTPSVSIYQLNEFPSLDSPSNFDYGSKPGHHLGEVTVTNTDGTRYVYGLPVYNTSQKEVMFTKDDIDENNFDRTQEYSAGQDNQVGNSEGFDNLYMSTEIPDYTYSYLVTAIYSADYVDLTSNGPTEDDFGYWVKFNYTKREGENDYGWRVPYRNANYSKSHISDLNDDKLSYMYGTKEVYYLNSVETKTHEAHFIMNDNSVATERRADCNGAPTEDFLTATSMGSANQLHYLKSVQLYSKADPATILKEVHFQYDYTLCGEVENNSGVTVTQNSENINAEKGKLTLKKVWFTNMGNDKGQLSPYIFNYDVGGDYDNPDYGLDQMDRWGNYMPDRYDPVVQYLNTENPYVNQSAADNHNNEYAAAWNLKKITLPSGGEIAIEYESDDYAYVQDQTAMQLQRIVGMGTDENIDPVTSEALFANGDDNSRITDRFTLVFFELERELDIASDAVLKDSILEYVQNVDDIYFKVFMKLKRKPIGFTGDPFSVDYVEGYCRPDKTADKWYGYCQPDDGVIKWGWIKVLNEERNPGNPVTQLDQPFKLAGWQYMRLERSDLFEDGNLFQEGNTVVQSIQAFVNLFNDVERLFGYFRFCNANNYCERLFLKDETLMEEDPKPSWIRLNTPDGIKFGGGHRVKSVKITDKWEDMSSDTDPDNAIYGTKYSYRMPDGTSSGVAEYEPLIGGEENALRKPLRYAERNYPYRNDGLYAEEPFGEGLYPTPNVGYRRVVVSSINNDDHSNDPTSNNVTINRTGITVTEFYTAKDFPVLNGYTDLQKKNFGIPVIIPFIGEISYNNKGYSQGFCLELNNMHGQIKSQAVYPAGANIDDPATQATSKAEYIYQTQNSYNPEGGNKLANTVDVLTTDGVYEQADIGKTHEFYIDRQQHSNFSVSAGLQTNAGALPPYVFWGNVFPYFEISRSVYRSISTMKIIQRNGVLSEVREYKDGAFTVNKTLMYDAETGQPLLTQTINNHNRPVYTYNYASHWAYDGMGPAYKNVGAVFTTISIASGEFTLTDPEQYFVPGDEIEFTYGSGDISIFWVTGADDVADEVSVIDENGNPVGSTGPGTVRILRSGRRNQQISTNGVIVSLSNPVTDRESPFFTAMNNYDASGLNEEMSLDLEDFYTDCFTGVLMDVDFDWNDGTHTLTILTGGGEGGCEASLVFNGETDINSMKEVFDYDLFYVAATGQVVATKGATTLNCTLAGSTTCFRSCLDNVLHAEAYRFNDEWDFNYLDLGNPTYKVYGESPATMASGFGNDYRFGTAGIWRMEESWLYQVDRKQDGTSPSMTSVAGDGTYEHFVLHNWGASLNHATQNPQWSLTNTVTMYDPHGYEVENVNPLGIYSSAMYGYGSSMPVAVASNTMYRELAFEGFEDYSSVATYESDAVPHGHTYFTSANPGAPIDVTDDYAHSGTYSLAVASNGSAEMDFVIGASNTNMYNPLPDKQYHLSVWVKCSSASTPYVIVENIDESTTLATGTVDMSQDAIDGWRQVNLDFTTDDNADDLRITLDCSNPSSGICYFDDLRIQPFTSGMKTYVYNPLTFWLVAELDDRNYATFYNYDEQGALVQVKKETENGIVTVSTSRSNTKR